MIKAYYKSSNRDFTLLKGDCMDLLKQFDFKFDTIFADPPYFLSNGGISVQSGKIVSVDKGDWDKGLATEDIHTFNKTWLSLCREKLKEDGTIWISGTYHNIFSVANANANLTTFDSLTRNAPIPMRFANAHRTPCGGPIATKDKKFIIRVRPLTIVSGLTRIITFCIQPNRFCKQACMRFC